MTNKHTQGPWFCSISADERFKFRIETGNGVCVAVASPLTDRADSPERYDNARLIAAAPCLLEALEYALNQEMPLECFWSFFEDMARAAIAKAKGES